MKKGGLSNIIATVLLIVLILLAAILIWVYIRSTITTSSERSELRQKCLVSSAEMLNCKYSAKLGDYWFTTGRVKMEQGEKSPIQVTFNLEDGSSHTAKLEPLEILETKKILPPVQLSERPSEAIATPIVSNEAGSELTCPIAKSMKCNEANFSGNLCELPTSVEDITHFIRAMTWNQARYDAAYPNCEKINADFSCNNILPIDFDDINPFVKVMNESWILCNRTTICSNVTLKGWGENWYQNPTAISYFNSNCK